MTKSLRVWQTETQYIDLENAKAFTFENTGIMLVWDAETGSGNAEIVMAFRPNGAVKEND